MKRKHPGIHRFFQFLFAVVIAAVCFVAVSHRSEGTETNIASPSGGVSLFGNKVELSAGSFSADTPELTAVIMPGETALLSQFTNLVTADLRGSTCYDEIISYASANPAVNVIYDVTLPNGTSVSPDIDSLDLSSAPAGEVSATAALFKYLDKLSTVNLGTSATSSLTGNDVRSLMDSYPGINFSYSYSLGGNNYDLNTESLDLAAIGKGSFDEALSLIAGLPSLKEINLTNADGTSDFTFDDIERIDQVRSGISFNYSSELYGIPFSLSDDHIDLNHIDITDNGDAVFKALKYMPNCEYADMDSCGVPDERMAEIRDAYPNVDVVWRVWFGSNYSVRTNVTKILASKPSTGGMITSSNCEGLKYCTKVRYLDIGHNDDLDTCYFVANMPDLEICVISMCAITDLSPFANCPNLLWLECGNMKISDLSPLASCTNLRHLNIGACPNVSDISPLYDIDMLRLWIGVADPVPSDQVSQMLSLHPDCEINTTVPTGWNDPEGPDWSSENWKSWQKYLTRDWDFYSTYNAFPAQRPLGYWKVVYKAFGYIEQNAAYAFCDNDPLYYGHDEGVEPINVFHIDTSFLSNREWNYEEYDTATITPDVLEDPPGEIIWTGSY